MKLKRQIGLWGGVAMVVGAVIGMGAFVLIPIICAKAGGAAWLAVSIALLVSLVSVLPLIQLSSALPTAGAGFEYGRKFVSPIAGVLFSWWAILGGAAGVALVAYGLAESFKSFMPPGISLNVLSILLLLLFFLVYLTGVKLLMMLQIALGVQMLVALLAYTIPVLSVHAGNAVFSLPADGNFFMAVIISFNVCMGFQIIIELGEEMQKPQRNIPLALMIGAGIVLVFYIGVIAAYTGIVGLENLPAKPEMVGTSNGLLPAWVQVFIRIGIVNAGLTCFNGAAIAIPREIYAQSRAGVLPQAFSKVNKNGTPQLAVVLFFAITILVLLLGETLERVGVMRYFFGTDTIEFYGYLTIVGMMTLTIGISFAAWRLPRAAPDLFNLAYVKFSKFWLNAFVIVSILASFFLIVLVSLKWLIPLVFIVATILVLSVFRKNNS